MEVQEHEITLKEFSFPKDLPNARANFRFVVDIRYKDHEGKFASETSVMPGLDTWWECDISKKDQPNYVRDDNGEPKFDVDEKINPWDRLVLRFKAQDLYRIQVKVFDVDRPDFWDKLTDALSSIIGAVLGKVKEKVGSVPIVGDSLGSLTEDVRSTVAKLLGGGDKILFKGSESLDKDLIEIKGKGSANKDKPGGYSVTFQKTSQPVKNGEVKPAE